MMTAFPSLLEAFMPSPPHHHPPGYSSNNQLVVSPMRLALQAYTEPPPSPSFEAEQEAKALQQTLHLKGGVAALFAYNELCKINDGEYGGFGR